SAAHDDVFLAINDQNVAVLVHGGHIAGMEPAAAHNSRCGFGLLPVTCHYTVTARHNFANAYSNVKNVMIVWIYNSNCHSRQRKFGEGLTGKPHCTLPI